MERRPKVHAAVLLTLTLLSVLGARPHPAAAGQRCVTTYVVRPGDSWSKISHAVGVYIDPLAAANERTRRSMLHPGETLCVPGAGAATTTKATTTATTTPAPADTSCARRRTVTVGDSWWRIAVDAGVTPAALAAANRTTTDAPLHPGDRLCLPAAAVVDAEHPDADPPTATASPQDVRSCGPSARVDITVCLEVRNGTGRAYGYVYEGEADVFGRRVFGLSATDSDCRPDAAGDRPAFVNCRNGRGRVGSDWVTPFSTIGDPLRVACADRRTGDGVGECGVALVPGLQYVLTFPGPVAWQGLHYFARTSESHGCVREPLEVATYLFAAFGRGASIGVVILDLRPGGR